MGARLDAFRSWLLREAAVPSRDGMIPPVPTPAQDHLSAELGGFFEGSPGWYAAVKPRQIGWTTWLLLWSLWRAKTDAGYVGIWVMPHDKIAAEVLAKARAIALASGVALARDNAEQCQVLDGGRIVWSTIGGSEAVADVVGRAGTFSEAILTEIAYPYEPELVWVALDALRPALRRWRAPVMLDSTPNGKEGRGGPYYELVSQLRRGELDGAAALAGWWMEPSYREDVPDGIEATLAPDEREGMAQHGWTLAQVQWRRSGRRTARDRAKFAENYPESWEECFRDREGSGVLSDQAILRHRGRAWPKPLHCPLGRLSADDPACETGGRSWLRAYVPPVAGARYFAGLDSSSGRGRDAQGLVVLDAAGAVVAVARCYLEGPRLASLVARVCDWYGADLLAEAQWAQRVTPYLRGGVRLQEAGLPPAEGEVLAARRSWRVSEEATGGGNRALIVGAALDVVEAQALPDEALWAEARGLARKGERIEAGGGGHDDLIMALGLAATLRQRWAVRGARAPEGEARARRTRGERKGGRRGYL